MRVLSLSVRNTRSRITIHTSYNLGELTICAEGLANEVKKYIPELVVEYKPDFRQPAR